MFKISSLPFKIGFRYTYASTDNRFVSFISLISMLGIALGVAVLITALAVMNGFNDELKEKILSMSPELSLSRYDGKNINGNELKKVFAQAHIKTYAMAPYLEAQGLIKHGERYHPVLMAGIEPARERSLTALNRKVNQGSLEALKPKSFDVVLGETLANTLDVILGDEVVIMVPSFEIGPVGLIPRYKKCHVVGIFSNDGIGLASSHVFMHIADVSPFLSSSQRGQSMRIKLNHWFEAPQFAQMLFETLPPDYQIFDLTSRFSSYFRAIKMEKAMMFLTLSMLIAISAFNLIASQVMLVREKRGDIAILRTFGASSNLILSIFIIQGSIIGAFGTLLGLLGGVLLSWNIDAVVASIQWMTGVEFFSASIYELECLPSKIMLGDVQGRMYDGLAVKFASDLYTQLGARLKPALLRFYDMSNEQMVIQTQAISKSFNDAGKHHLILESIDFDIVAGSSMAIMGPSGSGKSTFLHILGGVDRPTSGEVIINGHALSKLNEEALSRLRNQSIGFVYQTPFLMKDFTVIENIMMPIRLCGHDTRYAHKQAYQLLERVRLTDLANKSVVQLSGGEKQRISILRAVANKPHCLLADEPTGHLDQENAVEVCQFMLQLIEHFAMSLVLVTHDMNIAGMMEKQYKLAYGKNNCFRHSEHSKMKENNPHHVTIIMDGNGRWAEARQQDRVTGHLEGAKAAKRAVIAARSCNIKILSLFAFSSENSNRPESEVTALMQLFVEVIRQEIDELKQKGVRLSFIGDRDSLPVSVQDSILVAEELTHDMTDMQLVVALNYSGQWDLLQAAQKLAKLAQQGSLQPELIDAGMLSSALSTANLPEPDLLIRTSGEKRISNFFLWQLAYTELFFTEKLWPDFDCELFDRALADYGARKRRYGNVSEEIKT